MTKTAEKVEVEAASEPSDKELVAAAKAGDTAAFGILIDRYQQKIYNLTYHMTGNKEDAEDMAQDAFVRAFKALDRFQGKSSFYTWLYRIATNTTLNHIRKRKKRQGFSFDDVDSGMERDPTVVEMAAKFSPRRGVSITELQEKLNKALQTLSEKHRTVVVMHDVEGIPHDEIADIVGSTSGTVRSRLFYARQQLQAELAEYVS